MASEQKNALIAVVLSGAILFGWQYYFAPKPASPAKNIDPISSVPSANTNKPVVPAGPIEPPKGDDPLSNPIPLLGYRRLYTPA